jgi:hypothetical protein
MRRKQKKKKLFSARFLIFHESLLTLAVRMKFLMDLAVLIFPRI